MYTEIFYKYLQGDPSNLINEGLIRSEHVEAMMDETKFKLHEDPEEVDKMKAEVDPNKTDFFGLDNWIQLMTKKQNYIEEDLVRAFKVFDHDDIGTVKREELKVAFMNLIGKHVVSEGQIDAMFNEALP
jgi:Ca2+-binding EF-hand superfamily protein